MAIPHVDLRCDENLCDRSEEEGTKGAAYKLRVHSAKMDLQRNEACRLDASGYNSRHICRVV